MRQPADLLRTDTVFRRNRTADGSERRVYALVAFEVKIPWLRRRHKKVQIAVSDMADMFNGAMDRFDWTLQGRREMYVPYNAYGAHGSDMDYDKLVQRGHLNPDILRYELHRVWVVEARLREGIRHINPRRTYYLDEDSYQILLADHYDERGALWRYSEAHPVMFYEVPILWTIIETHHDLQSGRFVSYRQDNRSGAARFDMELSPNQFSPQALRRKGRR